MRYLYSWFTGARRIGRKAEDFCPIGIVFRDAALCRHIQAFVYRLQTQLRLKNSVRLNGDHHAGRGRPI